MFDLVVEHLAERGDYRGIGVARKERGVKAQELSEFR